MKLLAYLWMIFLFFLISLSAQADDVIDRQQFIQRLTEKGIFLSTDVQNGIPRLVVTPEFYESDIESKQTATRVVYEYYLEIDEAYDTLVIIDGSTGTQIGTYTAEGLQL